MQITKILFTEAASFLGSHLFKKLINHGHQVTAIGNLYTGPLQYLESIIEGFVVKNLNYFGTHSDVIISNRIDKAIDSLNSKIFTRDLFYEN